MLLRLGCRKVICASLKLYQAAVALQEEEGEPKRGGNWCGQRVQRVRMRCRGLGQKQGQSCERGAWAQSLSPLGKCEPELFKREATRPRAS